MARVRALHLLARQTVAGLRVGTRRSIRLGQAVEFADYKPYTAGDNLRDLDWRVLARRDRLVVRRYRAETEMGATLVLDASADIGSTPEKWEQAVAFLATVAWLCFLENEPVGLRIVAGEGMPIRVLPARRGRGHVGRIFALLAAARPAGRAGLAEVFTQVGARSHARGLVVLVSDFMEPVEAWAPALDALVRRRADVRAIQLYDERETKLSFDHPIRLYSPEGGADEPLDPVAMREEVEAEAATFFAEVRAEVGKRRGLARLLEARGSLVDAIGAFLLARQAA